MKLLVTGGCGFIGSNFILYLFENRPEDQIINLDSLTYAGNLENLVDTQSYGDRHIFIKGDVTDKVTVSTIIREGIDAVVNFAAESHVDRSIIDCAAFINTNIYGTQVLLECCRHLGVKRFAQVSTDEVYGSLGPTGLFSETSPIAPNSPYAASKAAADLLVRSYNKTYGMDTVITRCSNNYGPYQFPEKLIPLMITNALENRDLPVYGDGMNIRDWIHVKDHCSAIDTILRKAESGSIYNIGGSCEKANIDIVHSILNNLDKPKSLIRFVQDRPGHDRRYAMDSSRLQRDLGWCPSIDFEEGIKQTIMWYIEHEEWWRRIKSGEYMNYYSQWYGNRLSC